MKCITTGSGACPQQIRGPSGGSLWTDEEKGRAFLENYTRQLQENDKEIVMKAWETINELIIRGGNNETESPVTRWEIDATLAAITKDQHQVLMELDTLALKPWMQQKEVSLQN